MFWDPNENFHPMECDGPGRCVHCDRRLTNDHNPETCELCKSDFNIKGVAHEDEKKN